MTVTEARPAGGPTGTAVPAGRPPRRTWLIWSVVIIVAVAAIVTGRMISTHRPAPAPVVSVAHPAAKMPVSADIEATWGLRFTAVIVVADNGGVEVRYQVLDVGKSAKIHGGSATSNELPTLKLEGSGKQITPSAVLMHFHHGDPSAGQSYSMIYGNAGGVVQAGDYLSIVMKDGRTLSHIQVSD